VNEPGGDGINVSKALKKLGVASVVLFPAGGKTRRINARAVTITMSPGPEANRHNASARLSSRPNRRKSAGKFPHKTTMPDQLLPSAPFCAPHDPKPRRPRLALPPLACDTHAHVCGPEALYPYWAGRVYTPPPTALPEGLARQN